MELHLKIIGFSLMILSSIHAGFPKYFNWSTELKPLSTMNREMMKVHTFFIGLMLFLMGLLCVIATNDLINTELGKTICLGFFIFWSVRLIIQLFGYSTSLWKGKFFETSMHIVFTLFWTYLSLVFYFIAFK